MIVPIDGWPGDPQPVWGGLGLECDAAYRAECPDCNLRSELKPTPAGGWWFCCGHLACRWDGSPADAVARHMKFGVAPPLRDLLHAATEWANLAAAPCPSRRDVSYWRAQVHVRHALRRLSANLKDPGPMASGVRDRLGLPKRPAGAAWGYVTREEFSPLLTAVKQNRMFSGYFRRLSELAPGEETLAFIPAEDGVRTVGAWIGGAMRKWIRVAWPGLNQAEPTPFGFFPAGFTAVHDDATSALRSTGAVVAGPIATTAELIRKMTDAGRGRAVIAKPLTSYTAGLAVAGNFLTGERDRSPVSWRIGMAEALAGKSVAACSAFLSAADWRGPGPTNWSDSARHAARRMMKTYPTDVVYVGRRRFTRLPYGWQDAAGTRVLSVTLVVERFFRAGEVFYRLMMGRYGKPAQSTVVASRTFREDPVGVLEWAMAGDLTFGPGAKELLYALAGRSAVIVDPDFTPDVQS